MYQKCQQLRKLRRLLLDKEREVEIMRKTYSRTQAEVEEFIENVEDPYLRKILTMRYLDNMRWNDIAMKVGGSNNEDSLRMMCFRFLSR